MIRQDNKDIIEIKEFAFTYCMCGCGERIATRDSKNRPMMFVCGHNRRKRRQPNKTVIELHKLRDIDAAKDIIINQSNIIHAQQEHIDDLEQQLTKKYYRETHNM